MIGIVFLVTCIIVIPFSIGVVFGGRDFFKIFPIVSKFISNEIFIPGIGMTQKLVPEVGEKLRSLTTKKLSGDHVFTDISTEKLKEFTERYKIGQIISLGYYYTTNRFDKTVADLNKVCIAILIANIIVAGIAIEPMFNSDFSFDFTNFMSLVKTSLMQGMTIFQLVGFFYVFIRVLSEISYIKYMFNLIS